MENLLHDTVKDQPQASPVDDKAGTVSSKKTLLAKALRDNLLRRKAVTGDHSDK